MVCIIMRWMLIGFIAALVGCNSNRRPTSGCAGTLSADLEKIRKQNNYYDGFVYYDAGGGKFVSCPSYVIKYKEDIKDFKKEDGTIISAETLPVDAFYYFLVAMNYNCVTDMLNKAKAKVDAASAESSAAITFGTLRIGGFDIPFGLGAGVTTGEPVDVVATAEIESKILSRQTLKETLIPKLEGYKLNLGQAGQGEVLVEPMSNDPQSNKFSQGNLFLVGVKFFANDAGSNNIEALQGSGDIKANPTDENNNYLSQLLGKIIDSINIAMRSEGYALQVPGAISAGAQAVRIESCSIIPSTQNNDQVNLCNTHKDYSMLLNNELNEDKYMISEINFSSAGSPIAATETTTGSNTSAPLNQGTPSSLLIADGYVVGADPRVPIPADRPVGGTRISMVANEQVKEFLESAHNSNTSPNGAGVAGNPTTTVGGQQSAQQRAGFWNFLSQGLGTLATYSLKQKELDNQRLAIEMGDSPEGPVHEIDQAAASEQEITSLRSELETSNAAIARLRRQISGGADLTSGVGTDDQGTCSP